MKLKKLCFSFSEKYVPYIDLNLVGQSSVGNFLSSFHATRFKVRNKPFSNLFIWNYENFEDMKISNRFYPSDVWKKRSENSKDLLNFCFYFLCFLYLRFYQENNKNKKWKQETTLVYHFLFLFLIFLVFTIL